MLKEERVGNVNIWSHMHQHFVMKYHDRVRRWTEATGTSCQVWAILDLLHPGVCDSSFGQLCSILSS